MSGGDVVRAALWGNDLTRLRQPTPVRGQYDLMEIGAGGPDDLVRQLALASRASEFDVVDRLDRGCRAFLVWTWPDVVASWVWVSTGQEYAWPLRRTLYIPEGDCHGWDAGTRPAHRRRGLCGWLLEWAGYRMAEEGCRTMWNGILDENLASRRAHAQAGFRAVLRLLAVHEPSPGRLRTWGVDYADDRLVARARLLVGDGAAAGLPRPATTPGSMRPSWRCRP